MATFTKKTHPKLQFAACMAFADGSGYIIYTDGSRQYFSNKNVRSVP